MITDRTTFDEFTERIHQAIYVSATPAGMSAAVPGRFAKAGHPPTGLLDPEVFVRPIEGQIDDLIGEINATTDKGERTLVTTLTKKMAEDLTEISDRKRHPRALYALRYRSHGAHGDHPRSAHGEV